MPHHSTNSSDKIAFLALTYSDFKCSYIWEKFFNPQYKHLFNLYIHNKYPIRSRLSEYCLSETIKTNWGKFSLVEATFLLLEQAFKDENNKQFVLISDSHLPLHSMPDVYSKLKNQTTLDLNFLQQKKHDYFPILQKALKYQGNLFKHSQWIILTRKNVNFFLKTKCKYFEIFKNIIAEYNIENLIFDETYFGLIANLENIPYVFDNNCYVEFNKKNPQYMIDLGYHRVPFIFNHLNTKLFNGFASKHLFLRKISNETKFVGENFWFNF